MRLIKICQNMKKFSSLWKESTWKRGRYLHGIRRNLKIWIRVIRDFHYPNLTKEFTEEQQANIMRRFKEVENTQLHRHIFPVAETKFLTNEE